LLASSATNANMVFGTLILVVVASLASVILWDRSTTTVMM
jgi:hypothetical protein